MKVSDVMTPDVITVRADTTVDEIARLLTGHRINTILPALREGRLEGIISRADILRLFARSE